MSPTDHAENVVITERPAHGCTHVIVECPRCHTRGLSHYGAPWSPEPTREAAIRRAIGHLRAIECR